MPFERHRLGYIQQITQETGAEITIKLTTITILKYIIWKFLPWLTPGFLSINNAPIRYPKRFDDFASLSSVMMTYKLTAYINTLHLHNEFLKVV